ncbi:hypothetical protein GP486_005398 [Trichoglossum hirsutum]|uniref:Amidoligase enzyme n=1 Tax=Trichoglossum hirsutum TaxID=265104 RepID=A0A9P8L9B5_9PEZI|nr:hypothetical protein GP486_005398 [Trichoglossum hirsutum]
MSDKKNYHITANGDHIRLGVELEFIAQVPVSASHPEDYEFTVVTQALNRDTRDIRFKFNDPIKREQFDYEGAWTLAPERTVSLDPDLHEPGTEMVGMELISPITPLTKGLDDLTRRDIPYICKQLTSERIPGCDFWVNSTCGMHVHVSISQGSGEEIEDFEFLTVQNLVAFWGVYETQIEKLHPPYRRSRTNIYAASLRANVPHDPRIKDLGAAQWLFLVYSCKTFNELRNLIDGSMGRGDPRDSKVNIVSYSPHVADTPRPSREPTIEFREHAGTLDPTEVRNWILFVTSVVRFAIYLTRRNCRFKIEDDRSCAIEDIFLALDFGREVWRYYWEKVMESPNEKVELALKRKADEFDHLAARDIEAAQEIYHDYLALQSQAKGAWEEKRDSGPFGLLAPAVMEGLEVGRQDNDTERNLLIRLCYFSLGEKSRWDYYLKGLSMAWHRGLESLESLK